MRKSRISQQEQQDSHRWIISYADFMTLLFAFFVVMYAVSSINTSKYNSVSKGMKSAFNKKDRPMISDSTVNQNNGPESKNTMGKHRDGLDDLNKTLSELADESFAVKKDEGWLELDIKANALFEPGTSDLKTDALVKLMQVAEKIKEYSHTIVVEGYTDNSPISTPQFPSNWELSASRAASIGRILNGFGIDNNRMLVIGYGEQFPVSDNDTEEGRGKNRRVNIIIANSRNAERLINPSLSQSHTAVLGTVKPVQPPVTTKKVKEESL